MAVAEIVDACTDTFQTPKPPWKPRKEAYIAAISKKPADALLVSAADKLNNARAIVMDLRMSADRDAFWARFTGAKEGTLWYYEALVDAFRERRVGPIVNELEVAVEQMKELAGQ